MYSDCLYIVFDCTMTYLTRGNNFKALFGMDYLSFSLELIGKGPQTARFSPCFAQTRFFSTRYFACNVELLSGSILLTPPILNRLPSMEQLLCRFHPRAAAPESSWSSPAAAASKSSRNSPVAAVPPPSVRRSPEPS
jgi:hypothetical protein